MYYKKNDSRMGDEIFAIGAVIAPYAWKLVKKGQAKAENKKAEFDALPIEVQQVKKYKLFSRAELVFKVLLGIRFIMVLFAIVSGTFEISILTSFISLSIAYFIIKAGKKKYEVNHQATTK